LRATLVVLAPILVGLGEPTQQHSAASADAQASEIYIIQTDGSGRRDISSSPSPDSGPVVSPDGKSIAFVRGAQWRGPNSVETADIWVMSLDGGRQVALASGPHDELSPSWAPDSRTLAFEDVNYEDCRPDERYCAHTSVALAGPAGRRTLRADSRAPRFSPARQVLVFEDRLTNNLKPRTISSISARGRGFRVLTRCPVSAPARRPVWSHDAPHRVRTARVRLGHELARPRETTLGLGIRPRLVAGERRPGVPRR
jgi:Tol biopolymer transport system component